MSEYTGTPEHLALSGVLPLPGDRSLPDDRPLYRRASAPGQTIAPPGAGERRYTERTGPLPPRPGPHHRAGPPLSGRGQEHGEGHGRYGNGGGPEWGRAGREWSEAGRGGAGREWSGTVPVGPPQPVPPPRHVPQFGPLRLGGGRWWTRSDVRRGWPAAMALAAVALAVPALGTLAER
ncbi:hypothetical protein [Streptomyces albus]|uniref:hypothetical protein n=1 Tax=Streptomyces albus TaxID=1888 RepID=UPI000A5CDD5D|nr:hypothetical protein [Streptomyces albus]